jgi:hypothetical protein
MNSDDLVFEFLIKSVSCRNVKNVSSPLVINITNCTEITVAPKSTTICKLTYNKGKRIIFNQTNFTNIKTNFTLQHGHGDTSTRATCSFDFYEIYKANDDSEPTVFNIEAGLDDVYGQRFGTLELSFQIFPLSEWESIQNTLALTKTATRVKTVKMETLPSSTKSSSLRFSLRSAGSSTSLTPRQNNLGEPTVPRLNLPSAPLSSRSAGGSIHDRYMKKNELWLGHHCSTRCDELSSSSTRTRSSMKF